MKTLTCHVIEKRSEISGREQKNFFLSITLFFFIINSTYSQFYRIKTPLFIVVCILFGKLSKYEGEEETTKDRHELFITKKKEIL